MIKPHTQYQPPAAVAVAGGVLALLVPKFSCSDAAKEERAGPISAASGEDVEMGSVAAKGEPTGGAWLFCVATATGNTAVVSRANGSKEGMAVSRNMAVNAGDATVNRGLSVADNDADVVRDIFFLGFQIFWYSEHFFFKKKKYQGCTFFKKTCSGRRDSNSNTFNDGHAAPANTPERTIQVPSIFLIYNFCFHLK